ncbi:hypothetical protein GCM10022409_28210 [Hymenobacter glaciei]|uniref:Photosynthesis system II assembly factor Ycf48/Hcf136-like domain-containing protein n=2 Tax=Hymenobacter glaciei TaxID=877209 RepID=A0ABP7UCX6_9BACT
MSTGTDGQAIYLQQPNAFTRFLGSQSLVTAAGPLPSDVNVRVPFGRDFFAYPDTDTSLVLCRNREPLNSRFYFNLRRFDPAALRFDTKFFSLSKCMAINQNNFLLAPYVNKRPDRAFTFVLAAVQPGALGSGPVMAYMGPVVIPRPAFSGAYLRYLVAIDNYFLASFGDGGIYKIKQDGSFRQVYGAATVDAIYKWNNTLYGPIEYGEIITSTDAGETWQKSSGTPQQFTLASYYPVKDSLVCVYSNSLYSLRWNGPRYSLRPLKNDGLERATITGVEYLRDTVYVATTSGLFARPVKAFFEAKQ